MEERITLFSLVRPDINVLIELYFDEQDQLILDGYDIGKTVEEVWGDSDYEYTITIFPEEVEKLYPLFDVLPGNRKKLLRELKKRFRDNSAFTLLGEFMDAHDIAYSAYTWT
jgi:hypothetical protein